MNTRQVMQSLLRLAESQEEEKAAAEAATPPAPSKTQPHRPMKSRTLYQQIGAKRAEIERLSSNAEALDISAEAMRPNERAHAQQAAKRCREQVQRAIIALHDLEARLPQTAEEVDWAGQFTFETEPVKLPAEMAQLWAGNIDRALAA